jgi:hypothetical protein
MVIRGVLIPEVGPDSRRARVCVAGTVIIRYLSTLNDLVLHTKSANQ